MGAHIESIENLSANERRSQRWVDPKFQKRYAMLLVSVVLLVSSVLVATFWFHSEQVLKTLSNAGVLPQHSLYILVQKQMLSLIWSVIAVTTLFSIFILMLARFLSHRIVGPIFAIKRSLEAIGRGDFVGARLKLRSDDEFQDVGSMINEVVDKLEAR